MERNEYFLNLTINQKKTSRVIIDQHYKIKHNELDDKLILDLVLTLDGEIFEIDSKYNNFEYFVAEPVLCLGKPYRVILLHCIDDNYLGVINAFRVKFKGVRL